MATAIQNARMANEENARANRANETIRSDSNTIERSKNRAAQRENERANRAREANEAQRTKQEGEYYKQKAKIDKINAVGNTINNALSAASNLFPAAQGIGNVVKTVSSVFRKNDLDWYVTNFSVADEIARMPWGDSMGTAYKLYTPPSTIEPTSKTEPMVAPGIMAYYTAMTIGKATLGSAINDASDLDWSIINERNGRNSSYEPADIMQYLIAMSSLLSFAGFMRRLYGTLMMYSEYNSYTPSTLIRAQGVDFNDLRKHIYDFRGYINLFQHDLNAWPMIPEFKLADRWFFDYSAYLMHQNGPGMKNQIYFQAPVHFYKLDVTGESTVVEPIQWMFGPGSDQMNGWAFPLKKYDDIIAFGDNLLAGMKKWQDVKIFRSDINGQFAEKGKLNLMDIPENFIASFVYDEDALGQYQNAIIGGRTTASSLLPDWSSYQSSLRITQQRDADGAAYLQSFPKLFFGDTEAVRGAIHGALVNSPKEKPDAGTVIELTRLAPPLTFTGASQSIDSFISEFVVKAAIWYDAAPEEADVAHPDPIANYLELYAYICGDDYIESTESPDVFDLMHTLAKEASFEFKPGHLLFKFDVETQNASYYYSGDWDNFTFCDSNRLKTINKRVGRRMLGMERFS